MNKLSTAKRAAIVRALCEGCSIRSTVRMTGASKNTITKLIVELGAACSAFQNETIRNTDSKRVQADEIWSFVYARRDNVPEEKKGQFGFGDVWTWTAIDADTKLMLSWYVGKRDVDSAYTIMRDVASRVANRLQLTTDGLKAYLNAVDAAFESDIDYATIHKIYGTDPKAEKRYTPPVCLSCKNEVVSGNPDPKHISTSYVERANLSMRMGMRRFTRLTNAFSKKVENHAAMLSLYFMFYNFARVHQTLRVTPAMEAKIADHVWSVEEIVGLMDR
jgi:IS1 family transposase